MFFFQVAAVVAQTDSKKEIPKEFTDYALFSINGRVYYLSEMAKVNSAWENFTCLRPQNLISFQFKVNSSYISFLHRFEKLFNKKRRVSNNTLKSLFYHKDQGKYLAKYIQMEVFKLFVIGEKGASHQNGFLKNFSDHLLKGCLGAKKLKEPLPILRGIFYLERYLENRYAQKMGAQKTHDKSLRSLDPKTIPGEWQREVEKFIHGVSREANVVYLW